jgi:hypothetical protein
VRFTIGSVAASLSSFCRGRRHNEPMSNVAEKLDMKSPMIQWLNALGSFYMKDIRALPNDQILVSPGGCARSAQAITGEVIGLCRFATKTLRSEPTEDSYNVDLNGLDTGDQLAVAVEKAIQEFGDAIANAPDEIWTQEVMPPWQMKDTVWGITNIAINHIWYHDGQINTYQCLLGDEKVHWMD